MTIEAVIFDIGNVLIKWQPESYYDRVIGPERRKAFFADVPLHEEHQKVDEGASLRDVFYNLADQTPEWADELRMWHDNWNDLAAPEIPHSVRLLNALKLRGVPVFTLTNFGHDNFPISQEKFGFLKCFDREYVSGRLNLIKPDPAIYAHVEQDCGITPEALLFTDDREDNIATASARGWQTHHFTGPMGWADRLVAEGLLSAKDAE
ncbi:2-haloacid dehalogenase [Shimia gijangensis]|uniref:2-haloacid dehalogenase n=1 Tax=Shimia gijangensis TaxID=1470563 RepID=A0A1M6JI94_9RHOB|nr:HAD family phosphatase [Shimia gijangensis]SHJ46375.1 2-haloacid dehalogenase [Shimia gijangensis]